MKANCQSGKAGREVEKEERIAEWEAQSRGAEIFVPNSIDNQPGHRSLNGWLPSNDPTFSLLQWHLPDQQVPSSALCVDVHYRRDCYCRLVEV